MKDLSRIIANICTKNVYSGKNVKTKNRFVYIYCFFYLFRTEADVELTFGKGVDTLSYDEQSVAIATSSEIFSFN